MKVVRHKTVGINLNMVFEICFEFLKKEPVVLFYKKELLTIIPSIVEVVEFTRFEAYHLDGLRI
ncbi:MAG: hypothetical protein RJQ09_14840 [Cyclobacteriaceae bacterium]